MTMRSLFCLTLAAMCVFPAIRMRAAVPVAKNGEALAVIVHNGQTEVAPNLAASHVRQGHIRPPAGELAHYLQQITGAEFAQVESLAEAGQRPAIVLALVDRVPGADDGPAGQQAYRIRTGANRGIIFWMGSYPWILKNRGLGIPGDHTSGALAAGHNLYNLLPRHPRQTEWTAPTDRRRHPGSDYGFRNRRQRNRRCGSGLDPGRRVPARIARGSWRWRRASAEIDSSRRFLDLQAPRHHRCLAK